MPLPPAVEDCGLSRVAMAVGNVLYDEPLSDGSSRVVVYS